MKFFKDILLQENKHGHQVCGDTFQYVRNDEGAVFVLCDGIGSGIYANNAAITCASRLTELYRRGISLRTACEMVASSMHRAREEDIPFSAFTAMLALPDGRFSVYNYETPPPILYGDGFAKCLEPRFYTAGYEVIGESTGTLKINDGLFFYSDGVTQAGLGHGYTFGVGVNAIMQFINRLSGEDITSIMKKVMDMCLSVSGGRYEDDTTMVGVYCNEARQVTLLTGPPSRKGMDAQVSEEFMASPGRKVVCGSTTIDILCREMKLTSEMINSRSAFGLPPEYRIEGVDIATEGAVLLNQVNNILDEPPQHLQDDTAAERLCLMLLDADVIYVMNGDAVNQAHDALLFKQLGIRPRKDALKSIEEKLSGMGKMVIKKRF